MPATGPAHEKGRVMQTTWKTRAFLAGLGVAVGMVIVFSSAPVSVERGGESS